MSSIMLQFTSMAKSKAEQFTLFEIPATTPKRVRTKWEELQEMAAASENHGGFIPVPVAAELLNLSRQRVYALVEQGRIPVFHFFGKTYVAINDVSEFLKLDRKNGRPVGERPDIEAVRDGKQRHLEKC